MGFERILIANNGMAAAKFLLSMKSGKGLLGSEPMPQFFGMVSGDDLKSNAAYIQYLDYIITVPSGPSRVNYGCVELIVEIAKKHACDAVWPGWGHASENYLLAQALEAADIAWIGPSSHSMKLLGDKVESLLQAQLVGVPCAPWSGSHAKTSIECGLNSEEEAVRVCNAIGYPVMLKASNGGGGRGIRRVDSVEDVGSSLRQIWAEVGRFNGIVFAMKCVSDCRHVEIQIVGNGLGSCLALSGRDCSIQRRHQKLVEEGPPPNVPVMRAMELAAETLCSSVKYANAGTVEFLFSPSDNTFYFLEVNCRLQVEHPVTELLWGINLPVIQVLIAYRYREWGRRDGVISSLAIPLSEMPGLERVPNGVPPSTHVLAVRIVAEDPYNNWLPSGGDVFEVQSPVLNACKFFAYFAINPCGGRIHQYSDSQFGHVFVAAPSREQCFEQIEFFLKSLSILGSVTTNVEFMLANVLTGSTFRSEGPSSTTWLDGKIKALGSRKNSSILYRSGEVQCARPPSHFGMALVAACAHLAMESFLAADAEVVKWVRRGHRAPHTPSSYSNRIRATTEEECVFFEAVRTDVNAVKLTFSVSEFSRPMSPSNHRKYVVYCRWDKICSRNLTRALLHLGSQQGSILVTVIASSASKLRIKLNSSIFGFELVEDKSKLIAPLNGRLVRWLVDPGAEVTSGQKVCEIEAMKMVTYVIATENGAIAPKVAEGVSFIEGDVLAVVSTTVDEPTTETSDEERAVTPLDHLICSTYANALSDLAQDQESLLARVNQVLSGFCPEDGTVSSLLSQWSESGESNVTSLVRNFVQDEVSSGQIIAASQGVTSDGPCDSEITSAWRKRLALPKRMEFIVGLLKFCDSHDIFAEIIERLDPLLHRVVVDIAFARTTGSHPLSHSVSGSSLHRGSGSIGGISDGLESLRKIAQDAGSFYIHDLPEMVAQVVSGMWETSGRPVPADLVGFINLFPSLPACGMVAWRVTVKSPELEAGRELIIIANDITVSAGSFSVAEDQVYLEASKLARRERIPRIYIACNSGARLGLCESVQKKLRIKWIDPGNISTGFEYLYLLDEDYRELNAQKEVVVGEPVEVEGLGQVWKLSSVIGDLDREFLGVENLMWSGAIAGETSLAYDETFTLTYVTGRTVGIGAYIARLGQRVIQKINSPILLTGFQALNKLIGSNVYHSNDEIGGVGVMFRNGVSHLTVKTDLEGVFEIFRWLSFLPVEGGISSPIYQSVADPIDRPLTSNLNGRMLVDAPNTIFDNESFVEVQSGWAKSVVVGRARIGGIPIGVILVETRQTQFYQPADPADPQSQSIARAQAGQVWYPDSAYKTAQAIEDFNRENLPLMILANWRGFSGGQRDMFNEILKYGSYIVDALREYRQRVFVYLPPKAELRGGAWVVVDSRINHKGMIEMYADPTARGGVLEPSGTTEIKFRANALKELYHRNTCDSLISASDFQASKPTLVQVANAFADLHDTPQRMLRTGAINDIVEWQNSRKFFHNRLLNLLPHDGSLS